MEISLNNFLCHLNRTFFFKEGFTAIIGENGVGKSTIFLGLRWCLYGNVKGIDPFTPIPKKRTEVNVKMGNIIINRKNSPMEVKFTSGKQIFTGKEATGIINKLFGSEDVWLSSSFMEQKEKSKLLDVSNSESANKERMSLLQKIAFGEDEPSIIIENISQEIKDIYANIKSLEGKIISEESSLEMLLSTYTNIDIDNQRFSDKQDVDDLLALKEKYNYQLKNLNDEYTRNKDLKLTYDIYAERLEKLYNKLNDVPNTSNLEKLKSEIKDIGMMHVKIKSEHDILVLVKQLQHKFIYIFASFQEPPPKINESVLNAAIIYEESIKICQELNLRYNENVVDTNIRDLENTIVHFEYLERQTHINDLKSDISEIDSTVSELKENITLDKIILKYMSSLIYILQDIYKLFNKYKESNNNNIPIYHKDLVIYINNKEVLIKEYETSLDQINLKKENHFKFKILVDNIPSIFNNSVPRSISEINLEIDSRRKTMKCPHCNKNVCYINKSLKPIKGSISVKELEKEKFLTEKYNNIISDIREVIKIDDLSVENLKNNELYLFDVEDNDKKLERDIIREKNMLDIIRKILIQIDNYDEIIKNLDNLEEDISQLRIREDLCLTKIINHVKTAIIEIEEEKVQNEGDLEKLYNNIRINKLITKLDNIPKPSGNILSHINVQDATNRLILIKKVKVIKAPEYSSKVASDIINWHKYYNEFKYKYDFFNYDYKVNLCSPVCDKDIIDKRSELDILIRQKSSKIEEINRLEDYVKDKQHILSNIKEHKNKLLSLGNIDTINLEDMGIKIENIRSSVNNLYINIEWLKAYKLIDAQKYKVNDTKNNIMQLTNKHIRLIKLRTIATETNYQLFENALAGINEIIDEIASNLFEDSIVVRIDMYKQIAKQTKPKINLVIEYGGNQYKHIGRISGGEENKVSIALCAAFSSYSKFPFIILDESLSWISHNARETCLETLKSTGKNIILISQTKGSAHADNVMHIVKH